jgi:hypothetical protein
MNLTKISIISLVVILVFFGLVYINEYVALDYHETVHKMIAENFDCVVLEYNVNYNLTGSVHSICIGLSENEVLLKDQLDLQNEIVGYTAQANRGAIYIGFSILFLFIYLFMILNIKE